MNSYVLVYEDNPINARLIVMFLERSGFFAKVAATVDEFSSLLAGECKAALIDVTSPSLSSKIISDFIQQASKKDPVPPFIALLNSNLNGESVLYLNMGFSKFIVKPLNGKALEEAINHSFAQNNPACLESENDLDIVQIGRSLGIEDESILVEIFKQLFSNSKDEIPKMYEAADSGNLIKLKELAHSIKGSSSNLRLSSISVLAEEIEHAAKESKEMDYRSMISGLEQTIEMVYVSFKKKYL